MTPKVTKLPNGLRVLLLPSKGERTATALILVATGSEYETKKENGIAHFLEHMCFKGTVRRPDQLTITKELDGLGAESNAFTGHEYTGYYAKVAAGYLPKALDILSDIYANSLLAEGDIEKERGAIVGEIDMYEDVPMRKVGEVFMRLLYGDSPAGRPIAGTKELVRTFTREDFLSYRETFYTPSATLVVVAGGFDVSEVKRLIARGFSAAKPKKAGKKLTSGDKQAGPAVLIEAKDSDQTHLVLGVRSFPLDHAQYPALGVLGGILGGGMSSRLFQKIRTEMGLGYYVHAGNDSYTDRGAFMASAGVENRRVPEAVAAIRDEFARLKDELVSEDELQKTKDMIAGRLVLGLESSDEIAEFYGFQEILGRKLRTPEEVIARMRKVTARDIQTLARKIFVTRHLNLAMVGPWKDETRFRKLLTFEKA